jgi:V/A-type H+-transporting ATPase subunit A
MEPSKIGRVTAVTGNLIRAGFVDGVAQNEVAYVILDDRRLRAEVIRVDGDGTSLQVFEETRGIKVGDRIEFVGNLLSVALGPGLLGQIYDGLQNPLPKLAEEFGFFLPRGVSLPALDPTKGWPFKPSVAVGDRVAAGHFLGWVPEGIFRHHIIVPCGLSGPFRVANLAEEGVYRVDEPIAELEGPDGRREAVKLMFDWPVKIPIKAYHERFRPTEPLITKIRAIDSLFPIAKGGTYCIPGPFGAGKTVLQQITARHAEVDVVVIAACGERAGEVVETLREFPRIEDPRTGRSLMERTIIICNTSSMPVAARESSVYTAVTIAEYYRQLGLDILLLADSTSRWAQAMREISGRLEEIPGEEAYPAYLESRIAQFYERAGVVSLHNGEKGSLTIGGTVSPAGGTFEEPVTQGTLKVVGCFHGLSRDRANARRYPAIDPHESWSKYPGFIGPDQLAAVKALLSKGRDIEQMMKVVGEEGTSLEDYVGYLASEFFDQVYLQQNAFDDVDSATAKDRQAYVFAFLAEIMETSFSFSDKAQALQWFQNLRQTFVDWNTCPWQSEEFKATEGRIHQMLAEAGGHEEGS